MKTTTRYYMRTRQVGKLKGPSPWSPTTFIDVIEDTGVPAVESQKITPVDTAYNSYFGWSTALSADGKTVAIGAYLDNSPKVDAGAAYIFVKSGLSWVQQAKLVASDAYANDALGRSVDISDDGNTIVVGSYQDDDMGSNSGAVYIFVRNGTTWSQQVKLDAIDGAKDDFFGYAVCISGDGKTIFVGSPQDDDNANACGSGYIYNRNGTSWILQSKFVPSELKAADMFGIAADLSQNGNVLLVGAYRGSYIYLNQGAAYIFTRTNGVWKKTAVIIAPDPTYGANFGQAVNMASDGLTAFIGAYHDASSKGAVYVYTYSGSAWIMKQKLVGSDTVTGDNFGVSIASTALGESVIIGSMLDASPLVGAGAAYIFVKTNGVWIESAKLTAHDALKNDNFGRAVAISADGRTAIATATGLATVTASTYVFN